MNRLLERVGVVRVAGANINKEGGHLSRSGMPGHGKDDGTFRCCSSGEVGELRHQAQPTWGCRNLSLNSKADNRIFDSAFEAYASHL